MFTNNYWNLKGYIDYNPCPYDYNVIVDLGLVDTSGNPFSVRFRDSSRVDADITTCKQYAIKADLTVVVGSGDSDPELDDYCLDTDETSNFSQFTVTYATSSDAGKNTTIFTISGTNSTDSDIVLKEYGIIKTDLRKSSETSFTTPILLLRSLFNDPIVVPAGESFSKTISWEES